MATQLCPTPFRSPNFQDQPRRLPLPGPAASRGPPLVNLLRLLGLSRSPPPPYSPRAEAFVVQERPSFLGPVAPALTVCTGPCMFLDTLFRVETAAPPPTRRRGRQNTPPPPPRKNIVWDRLSFQTEEAQPSFDWRSSMGSSPPIKKRRPFSVAAHEKPIFTSNYHAQVSRARPFVPRWPGVHSFIPVSPVHAAGA